MKSLRVSGVGKARNNIHLLAEYSLKSMYIMLIAIKAQRFFYYIAETVEMLKFVPNAVELRIQIVLTLRIYVF